MYSPDAKSLPQEDRINGFQLWLPFFLFPLYTLLKYGLGGNTEVIFFSVVGLVLSYPLGIYVYYLVIRLAFSKRITLLVISMLLAASIASILIPQGRFLEMTIELLMITVAGTIIGRASLFEKSQLKLCIYGFVPLVIGALIMLAPNWSELMIAVDYYFEDVTSNLEAWFMASGYTSSQAGIYTVKMKEMFKLMVRILPAMTILNLMVPMAAGFIWFMNSSDSRFVVSGRLKAFKSWKVPFAMTPVLIVVILARLIGGETIQLIADNCLVIISVCYSLGGLALIQFIFKRLNISIGAKLLIYLMLLILGEYGYLLVALLGFIDSFADWRNNFEALINHN